MINSIKDILKKYKLENSEELLNDLNSFFNKIELNAETYKKLIEHQGEGIGVTDKNEAFTFSNPAAEKIFEVQTLVGKSLCSFVDKSEQERIKKQTSNRENGIKSSYELKITTPKGSEKYINVTATPKLDDNNNFIGTYGIFRDITMQKEIESALKESESKFKAITKSAQDAIILIDNTATIIFWNKAAEKIFGYTEAEAVGNQIHSLISPPKYHDMQNKAFPKFAKSGQGDALNKVVELTALRKNGEEFPIELSLASIKLHKKWHAIGIIRDTSSKAAYQKALIDNEEKFRTLATASPAGVYLTDKNGNCTYANPRWLKIADLELNEAIGHSWEKPIHQDDKEFVLKQWHKSSESKGEQGFEYRVVSKKGYSNWVYCTVNKIINSEGDLVGYVGINTDINERKEQEETLKIMLNEAHKKQEELNDLNATKDRFFSIIAHDLRGPVNNLVGFADLLECNYNSYSKERLSHIINLMNTSAKKTYALLENLLIWSKSQRDKISFAPEPHLCNDLVISVIEEMEHLAYVKNINIISGNKKEGHSVTVDENMFKTVFRNIIANAIKFTPDGGQISIGCGKIINQQVEFFVKDNGIGIAKKNINKLFKLDQNISTEGTNKEKGTGLGLILCKEFIEKHGGYIKVESEINKGSKFTFTFPLTTEKK